MFASLGGTLVIQFDFAMLSEQGLDDTHTELSAFLHHEIHTLSARQANPEQSIQGRFSAGR
jgi:hypothetical protein